MSQTFATTVLGAATGPTGIEVPAEIIAALGPKKNPAVTVSLSGYAYQTTVGIMDGKFMIPLSAAHRAAAGLKAGDPVEVTLALDETPRTVAVPEDLAAALAAAGVTAAFDALATSKRKEAVRQVEEAKTPETRERRITKVVAGLTTTP